MMHYFMKVDPKINTQFPYNIAVITSYSLNYYKFYFNSFPCFLFFLMSFKVNCIAKK